MQNEQSNGKDNRTRTWVFTLNNFTEDDKKHLEDFLSSNTITYGIIGFEVGQQKGTPHIQGYLESKNKLSFKQLKSHLGKSYYIAPRKGTRDEARDYCKKENNFKEFGEYKQQGKRTDIDSARRLACEGGMRAVVETASYQDIKIAEKYLTYREPGRNHKTTVVWYYGPTGYGKSRRAAYEAQKEYEDDVYRKSCGAKWWDGYDRHKAVIIDDFRDSWWSLTEMLSLCDRYTKQVEVKGGWRQFVPEKIWITSCMNPRDCYSSTGEAIKQLIRRLDTIMEFVFEWIPPVEDELVSLGTEIYISPNTPVVFNTSVSERSPAPKSPGPIIIYGIDSCRSFSILSPPRKVARVNAKEFSPIISDIFE